MSHRAMSSLVIALGAMFLQQTFASVGKVLPAVVAPLILAELDADPAWVGVYYGVAAAASLFAQMGCGSFIMRYGALRMSQVALVLLGGGTAIAAEGSLPGFGASAIIGRGGGAVSTPTSSQLLGRISPPRLAPLIFSVKQTAVPAGLLISGFLAPAMASAWGWRGATLVTAAACVAFAAMLQPLRARFDNDCVPSRRFRLSDLRTTIASVLKARDLRRLSFACFAFNGVQSVFTAYFVTYLVALGYDLAAAGFLFSLVVAVAVPCRILWGWLGSFHVAPRLVMAGLAVGMAGSIVLTGLFTAAWPMAVMAAGGRCAECHRDVVARHSADGDNPSRALWQRRRSDRWRLVVWSDRRLTEAICFLSAAPDRRLRHRLGPVRSSGSMGGCESLTSTRAGGAPRSHDVEDGRD
jgi:MFS family permease